MLEDILILDLGSYLKVKCAKPTTDVIQVKKWHQYERVLRVGVDSSSVVLLESLGFPLGSAVYRNRKGITNEQFQNFDPIINSNSRS